jgi:hypothetical protein
MLEHFYKCLGTNTLHQTVLANSSCEFVATQDDNVTFVFAGVWKSYRDLMDHLVSDSTIKFLKDLANLRVVFKTTQVVEVAADKGHHVA